MTTRPRTSPAAGLLAAALCAVLLALPAPAPAAGPGDLGDLPARLGAASRRAADRLAGGESPAQSPAARGVLELQRACLEALAAAADDDDLEVRLRVRDALDAAFLQARLARMLAYLPSPSRGPLLAFRQHQPRLFHELLSDDTFLRAAALRSLSARTDPNRLAEPLVALTLRHPSATLIAEAAMAIGRCEYRSDATVDALVEALPRVRLGPSQAYWDGQATVPPARAVLDALQVVGGRRASPALLEALLEESSRDSSWLWPMAEALAATGDKRLVGPLMEALAPPTFRSQVRWTWSMDGVRGTSDLRDFCLYAALKLTGQPPQSYGMLCLEQYGWGYIGFKDNQDRQKAYQKARDWWTRHQGKPPYDEAPLAVPPSQRPVARAPSASAPTGPPGAASRQAADAPPDPALAGELARRVAQLTEDFRSARFDRRARAAAALAELHQALLDPLTQTPDDPNSPLRRGSLDLLAEMITESNLQATLGALSADHRLRLRACLRERPDATRAVFCFDLARRAKAVAEIASADDPNATAEPLIIKALKDPVPAVHLAAASAVRTGRYRSDEMIDAIAQALANATPDQWHWGYNRSGPVANDPGLVANVVPVLPTIGTDRALGLLVAVMKRHVEQVMEPAQEVATMLAETGQKRLIPTLIGMLEYQSRRWGYGGGAGGTVYVAPCDLALKVMIAVSGQDEGPYAFVRTSVGRQSIYGFKDDKARQAALARFRQWWDQHKDTPPYKDLQPLSVPTIPQVPGQHGQY